MAPINEVLPEKLLQAMPVSAEDWAQTPKSVQALVTGFLAACRREAIKSSF